MIKSSCNCCINIWDDYENAFDLYVIFPEYVGEQPMTDGTLELLEKAYAGTKDFESCEETREYIAGILEENDIEYVAILCRKFWRG